MVVATACENYAHAASHGGVVVVDHVLGMGVGDAAAVLVVVAVLVVAVALLPPHVPSSFV